MRRATPLLLLFACEIEPSQDLLAESAMPPPLNLTCTLLAPGSPFRCTVTGADPGQVIRLVAGRAGSACPPLLGGQCVSMRSPLVLGSDAADATGQVVFTRTAPSTVVPGGVMVMQAVALSPTVSLSNAHQATVYTALWLDGDAGQLTACMLAGDGLPRCFGGVTPAPPAGARLDTVSVGEGGGFCGIQAGTGSPRCWGSGSMVGSEPTGVFDDVEVGNDHACATRAGGQMECWGSSCAHPPPSGYPAIEAASAHLDGTCTLDSLGTLRCFGLYCFPASSRWPATPGTFTEVATSSTCAYGLDVNGGVVRFPRQGISSVYPGTPPTGAFTHLAAGLQDACVLDAAGEATCWGRWLSAVTPADGPFERLLVSNEGACGWSEHGPLRCWGAWYGTQPPDLPPSL